jgi:hypothetical protein
VSEVGAQGVSARLKVSAGQALGNFELAPGKAEVGTTTGGLVFLVWTKAQNTWLSGRLGLCTRGAQMGCWSGATTLSCHLGKPEVDITTNKGKFTAAGEHVGDYWVLKTESSKPACHFKQKGPVL